ncbi:NAD(P)H-binding protein, partial [Nonomuraea sp. NPDC049784]|uniref:NAD(P)H-binding protein n=1 Tax=Nonomuraea sp. NPDC049784 TaxID=3154361 RepID=UPI0033C027EE
MILVTGATGTIGGEVLRLLSARGERVRAMTREPSRVPALPGVEAVRGDFDDPASLAQAAAGAGTLFLLSAPGPEIIRHDEAALAAARAAGMRKAVKLSAIGTGEHVKVGDWHLPGEQALRASGMGWTVLRPTRFASNTLFWAPLIRAGQPIPNMTGTGTEGYIDPRDIAEVAVRALTSGDLAGLVLTLTGPGLLSVPDVVGQLGEALGRELETVDISLDAYRQQLLAAGRNPGFVDVALNGAELVLRGGNARLTDDVEKALGRPPRTYRTWAEDHRAAFT